MSRWRSGGRKQTRGVTSRPTTRSLGGIVGLLEQTLAEDTDTGRNERVRSRSL